MRKSVKTRKLKPSIKRITDKAKNLDLNLDKLTVYGVSKKEGISVTGKGIGKNLGNYFYFEGQKIAYNPYRVNIGSIGLSSKDFVGLISPAYVIFEVDETIYPEFLLLFLRSNVGIRAIKWHGDRGGVRSSLRFSDLGKIDFPDITYEEQKAFYIDYFNKLKTVDKADKEFDRQLTLISKLRQSTLQDALQGKLTQEWRIQNQSVEPASELLKRLKVEKERLIKEKNIKKEKTLPPITKEKIPFEIPESWEWCRMQTVFKDLRYGTSKKCDYNLGDNPVLRIPNISQGKINLTDLKSTNLSAKELESISLERGDILIIRSNGSENIVGRSAVIENLGVGFSFAGYLVRLQVFKSEIESFYLHLVLESKMIRTAIEVPLRTTTGVKNINSNEISRLTIPIPPKEEQKAIVEKVNQLLANYDNLEQEIKTSKVKAEKLMQSVLSELLGEENNVLVNNTPTKKETPLRKIKYNSKTINMKLVELLKVNGELHAEDLWKMSEYPDDIEAFYAELKVQVEQEKTIKESKEKGYLELL